jgi:UDP-N-acetylmuramyl-tripeptide synthetase
MYKFKIFLKKILPENFILWTHKMRAVLAAYYYGLPSKKLKIIGVTGTNGKTTTCNLIAEILEEAGYKVGLATTINFRIGEKEWPNASKMTTVDPYILQKLLKDMVSAGCHFGVIETTSHAVSQFRNWGIKYNTVVLTNITHEHLDYHKTFENYQNIKLKLFQNIKFAVLNKDDKSYEKFHYQISAQQISYAIEEKADISARKILYEPSSTLFTAITPRGQIAINSYLPGKFNIYNCLAAIGAGLAQGIDLNIIKKAIEKVKNIPGRMEKIETGQDYSVIIDYAHTPDAFEKIYETLENSARGKIIHVFGACGDRDKTKRPIMGALAGRYADYVILTNEDPYGENASDIIKQIAKGVPRGVTAGKQKKEGKNYFKILDRKQAIAKALSSAQKDDVVLITGKGAETCMVVEDKKIPWSDKKVVLELLGKK